MIEIAKKINTGERIVSHLCFELIMLHSSWAHWEALNGRDAQAREGFRQGVRRLAHATTVESLRSAILRDTVMTLFRMSDAPGENRKTLCRIALLLQDRKVQDHLIEEARKWNESMLDLSDYNANLCSAKIASIASHVQPHWKENTPPPSPELYNLRTALRPIRDRKLAHAVDISSPAELTLNQIRRMIDLTTELVYASQLIFAGAASSESALPRRIREANDFWDHASTGFLTHA